MQVYFYHSSMFNKIDLCYGNPRWSDPEALLPQNSVVGSKVSFLSFANRKVRCWESLPPYMNPPGSTRNS